MQQERFTGPPFSSSAWFALATVGGGLSFERSP
jgi:hypothetical protein